MINYKNIDRLCFLYEVEPVMKENVLFEKFPQLKNIPPTRKRQMLDRLGTAPDWVLDCFCASVLDAGTTLVYEGQPVTYIYYVLDGIIKATDYRVFGVEFDYARFTKVYAMGGMEVLMDFKTYRTTLKTVDRCIILKIQKELFDKWMMADIHALRYESKMMGEYLLEQGRRAREDLFLPGPERVSRLFVRKYEKYSKDGILRISVTRQELSNETGFTMLPAVTMAISPADCVASWIWLLNRDADRVHGKTMYPVLMQKSHYVKGTIRPEFAFVISDKNQER